MNIPDFPGFLWILLTLVFSGFVFLFWRLIQGLIAELGKQRDLLQIISGQLTELFQKINVVPLLYRTKDDAREDWQKLTGTLAEIQSDIRNLDKAQQTGFNQIWDKINRTVDSFFFLASLIVNRQQALEQKVYCDNVAELARTKAEGEELMRKLEALRNDSHGKPSS